MCQAELLQHLETMQQLATVVCIINKQGVPEWGQTLGKGQGLGFKVPESEEWRWGEKEEEGLGLSQCHRGLSGLMADRCSSGSTRVVTLEKVIPRHVPHLNYFLCVKKHLILHRSTRHERAPPSMTNPHKQIHLNLLICPWVTETCKCLT